jgi:hypothetical protein
MKGFITDTELSQAELEFPGIARLFGMLRVKPRTFLDLVALYDSWTHAPAPETARTAADSSTAPR